MIFNVLKPRWFSAFSISFQHICQHIFNIFQHIFHLLKVSKVHFKTKVTNHEAFAFGAPGRSLLGQVAAPGPSALLGGAAGNGSLFQQLAVALNMFNITFKYI